MMLATLVEVLLAVDIIISATCAYLSKKIVDKMRINPKLAAMTLFNQGRNKFMVVGASAIILVGFMFIAIYFSSNYWMYSLVAVSSVAITGTLMIYSIHGLNKAIESAF